MKEENDYRTLNTKIKRENKKIRKEEQKKFAKLRKEQKFFA